MGGDFAPAETIAGAIRAIQIHADLHILLVGSAPQLAIPELDPWRERIQILPATDVIAMGEAPVYAVRNKPESSMVKGLRAVQQGVAQAFVTAGNSGAAVVGASLILGRFAQVSRPALAVLFPAADRQVVLLDVGANVGAQASHMLQFAHLGAAFAQVALAIPQPRVGLLNVGEESLKGGGLMQDVYQLMADSSLNFVGNLEGWDLPRGLADVMVCDGLTGNLLLKMAEGIGELFFSALGDLPQVTALKSRFDYAEHGGSLVLGIGGTVVVTHGRAKRDAIANAIGLAYQSLNGALIDRTREAMLAFQN
jgi:glycerol-3-phosphate acyltransferase PlsX